MQVKPGHPPGSAVYTGGPRQDRVTFDLVDYTPQRLDIQVNVDAETAGRYRGRQTISWVDVNGIHDVPKITGLCRVFGLHPLSVEDILDPGGRAKAEYYDEYLYIVLKMLYLEGQEVVVEQVSLVMGADYVLTFQERDVDVFDPVRKRLQSGENRARQRGSDYLVYALMDAVVDHYHVVFQHFDDQVDAISSLAPDRLPRDTPGRLHTLRHELLELRRSVTPLREALAALSRAEGDRLDPRTRPFLRDLEGNLQGVIEEIDISRELASSLMGLHQAQADARLNEEMRILTVFASLFIPLTFVTSLYGMNFDTMPGLHWRFGYPTSLAVMVLFAVAWVVWFKRKGWL